MEYMETAERYPYLTKPALDSHLIKMAYAPGVVPARAKAEADDARRRHSAFSGRLRDTGLTLLVLAPLALALALFLPVPILGALVHHKHRNTLPSLLLAAALAATATYQLVDKVNTLILRKIILPTVLKVNVELQHFSLTRNGVELKQLRIDNAPGQWTAPFALRCEHFRFVTGGIGGWLSLQGLKRVGKGDIVIGFRSRHIESLDIDGLEIFFEQRHEEGNSRGRSPTPSISCPCDISPVRSPESRRCSSAEVSSPGDEVHNSSPPNNAPWLVGLWSIFRMLHCRLEEEKAARKEKLRAQVHAWQTRWKEESGGERMVDEPSDLVSDPDDVDDLSTETSVGEEIESALQPDRHENIVERLKELQQRKVREWKERQAEKRQRKGVTVSEHRFQEAALWRLGRLHFRNVQVVLKGYNLAIGPEGWRMCGFVGSETELKQRLLFSHHGLFAKIIQNGKSMKSMASAAQAATAAKLRDKWFDMRQAGSHAVKNIKNATKDFRAHHL